MSSTNDSSIPRRVAIIGAGVFGLSLALTLRRKGHCVAVFDQNAYHETGYRPSEYSSELAASVDHNKIFRASYGKRADYQRLALESRKQWLSLNSSQDIGHDLFVPCCMLRVQPSSSLGALEMETLASMERDGVRDTQFVKGDPKDCRRAADRGLQHKLLDYFIPDDPEHLPFEAVLDSLAGFTRCADGCNYFRRVAEREGVVFSLGPEQGRFASLIEETLNSGKKRAIGFMTADQRSHYVDTVVVAAGSFSTQILPTLSYHMESSAGTIVFFKIDPQDKALWEKYSPENFPVITWKSAPRGKDGKDIGSVYVLPRTPEGFVKIGYRGIKFTNFQPAPDGARFTQDGKWSIPLPSEQCHNIPSGAAEAIRNFVSIFMPDFNNEPFFSTKLCWYTDTLDNSFLVDYVPMYEDDSVFVCTGGSGHGAKFMPVLGEHAADIFENKEESSTPMRQHWRWREDAPRKNGLEDGPGSLRDLNPCRLERPL
ncbi:FAD dependent oxidoreductase [Aaosphaeria arxii CBS 175.79]|uniref:FAD dependent oxidoreductase n=1 Tax=Aaosphaeria arxii CBS 175.79 TaxID=1450172 RepID=A0A6A5XAL1_9PLEO|nr:FAD dependent oxidoreductase [Aaosphaeria arxii CBS 175.79]KAF2010002.1 FAD dependent oxidoreductase [Aaosphaeria arxii CBS 175.79]